MKRLKLILYLSSLALLASGQTQQPAYTPSKNYKVERTFISSNGQAVEDVVYTDGFGRKLQEIQVHGAPDGQKDLIKPYRYGVMGQVEKEFIPYARQANNGAFHADAFNAANWNSYGTDDAPYAFTLCEYEDSPLSRLIRQTGPGKNWHTAQKGVSTQYAMNTANEVRMFDAAPDGTLSLRGYYPAGALQKTTVTDEDGHTAVTYTDNQDREVLTLQTGDDGMKLETYRVYDDRGMLRWVLSPEATHQIQNSMDTDVLEKLAYYYEYDALGRMTLKRLPGCMPTRMVYDRRNRMVMSQDGNQRQENARKWCYSVYDDTNRVTETGEIVLGTDITHEDLQAAATANENYLPSGTKTPMQYCVYDSYAPTTEVTPHAFTLIQGYATEFNPTPSGLTTSVKTRLLGTDQWQTLTTYYDSFARPVQVIKDNMHGKTTRVDTQYDFCGNIVKQAETHVMPDGTGQVLESVNTYDARGRLLSVTSSLNGGTEATVTYAYDETGRAIAKQYGGTQEAISYNVRGWITAKESTPFSMRLRYENPQAGATACYNGNISEWEWQHEDASPMMYGFTYDCFGRMNAAVQKQKSGQNWSTLAQDYTEKGITYDRNGNILTLQRTAAGNLVDNLVYGYDGNRLVSLSEKVRNEQTGDIFLPGSTEQAAYEYDANGNMKKDYRKGLNFGYNFLNLVSDVWHNDTVKVRYQYLADGTKWSIRDASGNNGYDYDGSFVYKVQNGQPVFEKATALDVQFCNGQALYALTDQLGSTRVLIDAQGEVVQQNDFYPFGAKALKSGYAENDNRFLFSGKEQQNMLDVNTYDFGARMYDAAIARWTCVDPMGEKHINLSPYNYCVNNPMAYIDRDGKFSERWAAEAVRSIYQIFFGDNVGPVIENKDATSDQYRYTFNIVSFQNGEFTVTSYHEVDTYIAEMMQNAGDAISVAGYALTLSVVGAKFGVPIAVFGRTLSGIGAGLEIGIRLLNGDYGNSVKGIFFEAINTLKDTALKRVFPAYNKKYGKEGFDLGTNILRQSGDIKIMIIERGTDMSIEHFDKKKMIEKNNNLQNNR